MPGAPRGLFLTLANSHPSAVQPSARCLAPWRIWFGPVENKTLTSLQDLKCTFGGRGTPDDKWECDSSLPCGCDQGKSQERSSLGVASHPLFPPFHIGWLNRFRVLTLKACGTLILPQGDNSSSWRYLYMSALPHLSWADRSDTPES
jgi:hypothetical protein